MIAEFYVDIVRSVDEHFPGFVECQFSDADGHRHVLIDKVPMFTEKALWSDSEYLQPGYLRCQILDRSKNAAGDEFVRITIARPDGMETLDKLTDFIIPSSEIAAH